MGRYAERRKAKGESNGFLHLPLSARQLVRALSAKTYTARCCFSMCMLFMRPFTFTSCIRFMSSINFGVIATPGAGGKTSSIAVPTVSPPSRACTSKRSSAVSSLSFRCESVDQESSQLLQWGECARCVPSSQSVFSQEGTVRLIKERLPTRIGSDGRVLPTGAAAVPLLGPPPRGPSLMRRHASFLAVSGA